MLFNRRQLADLLGCNVKRIDTYLQRGMPYAQRATDRDPWLFESADVVRWLLDGDPGATSSKVRLLRAQAALKEAELDDVRGSLVSKEDASREVSEVFDAIRARISQIPAAVASSLAEQSDASVITRLLSAEIDKALTELTTSKEMTRECLHS